MAYAISENDAAKAPKVTEGQDSYVKEMYLKGTKYYLYVHRFISSSMIYRPCIFVNVVFFLSWMVISLKSSLHYILFFKSLV